MAGPKVRVLPDEIANRIAAGEVVERPASVVKELAENAVDAGASRIRVRVEGAGKRRVTVEDDGTGMEREDALLALERHATSKIRAAEDLDTIGTLGFRGEALPSIAAVSRFRLLTRPEGARAATDVRVEGGRLLEAREAAGARGTVVDVEDLFFNVPARRKFLKGDATELRHAVETVVALALAHFDVGFELQSGPRTLLSVPPGQSREERTAEIVGAEAPGGLSWFRTEPGEPALTIAYGAPHEGRGHRRGFRLFVNDRPVQDRLLLRAVMEAYRGLLAPGRYPVALVWLDLPPDQVDVNVHPAKREVRFRDEGRVFRFVAGRVAEALAAAPWAAGGGLPEPAGSGAHGAPRGPAAARVAEAVAAYGRRAATRREGGPVAGWAPRRTGAPGGPPRPGSPVPIGPGAGGGEETGREPEPTGRFGPLRYLGAFDATYLLFEDPDTRELVVIDQHAAHERVLYEALLPRDGAPRASQPLLFPVTLECSAPELAAYAERAGALAALGFDVEPFGPAALAVRGAPPGVAPGAVEAAVRDVLAAEELGEAGAGERERVEAAARRAACAAAVKARAGLDRTEAEALVRRLEALRNPGHCPHGRPLIVRLGRARLEALFGRR